MRTSGLVTAVLLLLAGQSPAAPGAPQTTAADTPTSSTALSEYFSEMEALRLIDIDSSDRASLKRELAEAEGLLRQRAAGQAAVALFAIVESPRYVPFRDFIEFQNAEYDLAAALSAVGAKDSALTAIGRVLARGPKTAYWAPAHRLAVNLAMETRQYPEVLAFLERARFDGTTPESAKAELTYLRGRIAYDDGELADAELALAAVPKGSRLYSSAVYLRGVMRASKGDFARAAAALCEVAATADDESYTFVVDERYFTIKDLARLGLGRIAHERGEYDDAFYHYFQIPDDSPRLPEALFEAAWSMYQKRELSAARDLARELLAQFPASPLWPEASLLAGYTDLADCKFDDAQKFYDVLIRRLQPIVDTMAEVRRDPERVQGLFARAVQNWRQKQLAGATTTTSGDQEVLDLLRLDPHFLRLHEAISGMREVLGQAPGVIAAWQALAAATRQRTVTAASPTASADDEQAEAARAVALDLEQLAGQVALVQQELERGGKEGTVPPGNVTMERQRLASIATRLGDLRQQSRQLQAAPPRAGGAAASSPQQRLLALIARDLAAAQDLEARARELALAHQRASQRLAADAMNALHLDTRRVLDRAKLGKVDAMIGQKRTLDIEVQDLAAGRFPPELTGRMWNAYLIGDDEEYWPWQGEFWADEYEGWR
jgi:tetratricopeptide (TPR) repeat protein